MKKGKRARLVNEAIRLSFSSLKSHLEYAAVRVSKKESAIRGGRKFHQKCVREYARIIKNLSHFY